jgi:hypothetical protein
MLYRFQLKTRLQTAIEDSSIPGGRTVPVAVAVLGSFLALLASTTAYAQAPAGPNRPAGVPDGYVITPFGYFHPSCVKQLTVGETLLAEGPVIQHADGTFENVVPCVYPHYTARGEIVIAGAAGTEPPKIGHSWIESADATTTTSYGALTATWTVPPVPASNDGQTVYFFPGLEDIDDVVSIIQPVLGWNADFGGAWGIASWNCCPSGITVESSPVRVNPGNEIKGTMKDACAAGTLSCSKWNVTSEDVSTGHHTTLSNTPSEGQTFNWAFAGALEVYNVVQCSDYPANGSLTFSDVALYDYNFDRISNPGWAMTFWATGLTPQCGYGGPVAPGQVTLDY